MLQGGSLCRGWRRWTWLAWACKSQGVAAPPNRPRKHRRSTERAGEPVRDSDGSQCCTGDDGSSGGSAASAPRGTRGSGAACWMLPASKLPLSKMGDRRASSSAPLGIEHERSQVKRLGHCHWYQLARPPGETTLTMRPASNEPCEDTGRR
jgi:hypothetical protein